MVPSRRGAGENKDRGASSPEPTRADSESVRGAGTPAFAITPGVGPGDVVAVMLRLPIDRVKTMTKRLQFVLVSVFVALGVCCSPPCRSASVGGSLALARRPGALGGNANTGSPGLGAAPARAWFPRRPGALNLAVPVGSPRPVPSGPARHARARHSPRLNLSGGPEVGLGPRPSAAREAPADRSVHRVWLVMGGGAPAPSGGAAPRSRKNLPLCSNTRFRRYSRHQPR